MTLVEVNYMNTIPVKCDCCGEMSATFSSRGKGLWFGKYLKPDEKKICRNCIKEREGYREEFFKLFGTEVDNFV